MANLLTFVTESKAKQEAIEKTKNAKPDDTAEKSTSSSVIDKASLLSSSTSPSDGLSYVGVPVGMAVTGLANESFNLAGGLIGGTIGLAGSIVGGVAGSLVGGLNKGFFGSNTTQQLTAKASTAVLSGIPGLSATPTEYPRPYGFLLFAQEELDKKEGPGKSVAGPEEWELSWKAWHNESQKPSRTRESHSEPHPLLMDKINSLPPNSSERRYYEGLVWTFTNCGPSPGLNNITREGYKDFKRITAVSDHAYTGSNPEKSSPINKDQIVTTEEEKAVSNLGHWSNSTRQAVKPISDATGSHADTAKAVTKTPLGPDQVLSTSVASVVDKTSTAMTNQVNAAEKSSFLSNFANIPSKLAGSLRHLATIGSVLAVPFDIASSMMMGLGKLLKRLSDLADTILTSITKFAKSAIQGLVDALTPTTLINKLMGPFKSFAAESPLLGFLKNGFNAIKSIGASMLQIGSKFARLLGAGARLAALFDKGAASAGLDASQFGCGLIQDKKRSSLADKLSKLAQGAAKIGAAIAGIAGKIAAGAAAVAGIASLVKGGLDALASAFSSLKGALGGGIGGLISGLLGSILGGLAGLLAKCGIGATSPAGGLLNVGTASGKTVNLSVGASSAPAPSAGIAVASGFIGKVSGLAQGALGHLGDVLGGVSGRGSFDALPSIRNPSNVATSSLPPEISQALCLLSIACNIGNIGNGGYSCGHAMDSLLGNAFEETMGNMATHLPIIGPLFNKDVKQVGSYAQENCFSSFTNCLFTAGAVEAKGVLQIGPGGTAGHKQFDPGQTTDELTTYVPAPSPSSDSSSTTSSSDTYSYSSTTGGFLGFGGTKVTTTMYGRGETPPSLNSGMDWYDNGNAMKMEENRQRVAALKAKNGW